jgi:hypothetical protein
MKTPAEFYADPSPHDQSKLSGFRESARQGAPPVLFAASGPLSPSPGDR